MQHIGSLPLSLRLSGMLILEPKRRGFGPKTYFGVHREDMASSSTDDIVVEDLEAPSQGMVGGIPIGLFRKLEIAQKNRNLADEVRKDKEELARLKQKRNEEAVARAARLKEKRATRHAEAKAEHMSTVQSIANEVKAMAKEAEAQRKAQDQEHHRQARVRVEHANNLDARLDAAEEAQDVKERREAAEARALLKQRAAKAKEKEDAKKAMLTDKIKKGRQTLDESKASFSQAKREKTNATKEAKAAWASTSNQKKEQHLEEARQRARIRAAEKATAREANEERARQRREAAREEKTNDAVASKALEDEVQRNRDKRAQTYKARYVPTSAVEHMEASDTFRRLYGLPDADGKIKSVSRPLPPQKPTVPLT